MQVSAGLVSSKASLRGGRPVIFSKRSPGLSFVCVCVLISPDEDTVTLHWGHPTDLV